VANLDVFDLKAIADFSPNSIDHVKRSPALWFVHEQYSAFSKILTREQPLSGIRVHMDVLVKQF
jgi:hypothetical protein